MTYRINQIVSLVPRCEKFFDVACDHGKIGILCLKEKTTRYVVFSDISLVNVSKAKLNCEKMDLSDCDFVVCNGVPNLKINKNDCVCVSGVGAETIIDIIKRCNKLVCKFIFQPSSQEDKLRVYLTSNRYKIEKERIIKDKGKYYSIILASKKGDKYKEITKNAFLPFVKSQEYDLVYEQYLKKKCTILCRILAQRKQNVIQFKKMYECYHALYEQVKARMKGD